MPFRYPTPGAIRRWFWRLGLRFPARPGWKDLLRDVVTSDLWVETGTEMPVVGAPLEWSLLRRLPDGRLASEVGTCAWHNVPIHGRETPDPDTGAAWGVRCARCGVAIRVGTQTSGMQTSIDPPSCPPCRRVVKFEILRIKSGL